MTTIPLDIETIPGQHPDVKAAIAADIAEEKAAVKAPGNYKDAAKIEQYVADKCAELDAQADERWRKTALDGTRGEIICISFAFDDEPVQNVWRNLGDSEANMLQRFFDAIIDYRGKHKEHQHVSPLYVGHNLLGFDLRFIYQRAVILGVKPLVTLPHDARGNNNQVYDTMLAWAGWGNRVSMNALCTALGLEGKGHDLEDGEDIDGSKVWDFVERGEEEKVATYCNGDVERTRAIYQRMTFAEAA